MRLLSDLCKWLHTEIENRPIVKYPFEFRKLPRNGIYFFYENLEFWGHGGNNNRIVRVGTHKSNNFRSRINEHFLLDDRWMNFNELRPAPKDRSIFRKNLGRTIINMERPGYLKIWNIDFTTSVNKLNHGHLRNIEYEKNVEKRVTDERIGSKGLESRLIGTISNCHLCKPSETWFGNYSPLEKIRKSGLWQVQHLYSKPITSKDKAFIHRLVC
jgi:hypothetical protein